MVSIEFENAKFTSDLLGLRVNGHSLEKIVRMALGPIEKDVNYNSCDITITIHPYKPTTRIETDDNLFYSVEEMEEDSNGDKDVKEKNSEE